MVRMFLLISDIATNVSSDGSTMPQYHLLFLNQSVFPSIEHWNIDFLKIAFNCVQLETQKAVIVHSMSQVVY